MNNRHAHRTRAAIAAALFLGLAGCQGGLGGAANSTAGAVPNVTPDGRGVITYASYQVAVARDGDTVSSVASRVGGVGGDELAALNGLPTDYRLRDGEVLALPASVPRGAPLGASGSPSGWSPQIATQAIDSAPDRVAAAPPADTPFSGGQTDPVIDPIRHRVAAGETAYSISRLYGVSVTALASWNGLGPDLAVRQNQELLIPVVGPDGGQQVAAAGGQPGQRTPVPPPPSAAAPLPENIALGAPIPDSPALGTGTGPSTGGSRLARPVEGPITKPYDLAAGPNRSEGVGFGVPAGTEVRAAGDGEVALVSESLGGLGTIVLIRHQDDLMTVYGRVTGVTVERGQRVSQGQTIGAVAAGDNPELHFEVRRGTDSVDPTGFIGG